MGRLQQASHQIVRKWRWQKLVAHVAPGANGRIDGLARRLVERGGRAKPTCSGLRLFLDHGCGKYLI
jgi:hypothetical protein